MWRWSIMQTDLDLKAVKKKVYMSYFQDGLWDILLGVYLLGWGLSIWLDITAVMGGFWVGFYFLVLGLKRLLIYPRSGYIKLNEARKQQMKMVLLGIVLFILGLVVFGGIFISRPAWLGDYIIFILITMMAVCVALLGYWWRVSRWYVFSAVTFAGAVAQQWLGLQLELGFFVPGGVIAFCGLWLLFRFLRKYPRPTREETDVVS
jgi:hypothetical protein